MTSKKIFDFFKPTTASANETGAERSPPKKKGKDNTSKSEKARTNVTPHNDVASFCGRRLNDNEKYEMLERVWIPDCTFNFPRSGNRNLRFQSSWLYQFPWLAYSSEEDGAYCRFCVLFGAKEAGKGSHQALQTLIQNPFKIWKKALEKFKEHQEKEYHKKSVEDVENFKLIYQHKKNDVVCTIDTGRKRQQHENRKKLFPIIRSVLLCGRQGIALRGHRDDGPLSLKLPENNDGNFRALLRFALESEDQVLNEHLKTAGANATYLSHGIQNEIVEAAGQIITTNIVERINKSRCVAAIADETTDISGIEQFSVCVRYVDEINGEYNIREDFLRFVPVTDVTGAGLAEVLLNTYNKIGVDLNFIKSQGYDGAPSMSGKIQGCAAKVRGTCEEAISLHCANHKLNLAITHACEVPHIRNCIAAIKQSVNFFRNSTKAGSILRANITTSCPQAKQTRLLKFCETRWVEHLDSLQLFQNVLPFICTALEELDISNTKTTGVQPNVLLASICKPQFIVSLTILTPIFSLTKSLSLFLQGKDCDLSTCVKYTADLYEEIQEMRANSEAKFHEIFLAATELAHAVNVKLETPRRIGQQRNRDNYEGDAESYFRRSTYIPFLDHFLSELQSRFLDHRVLLSTIENILPNKCTDLSPEDITSTMQVFKDQWPNDIVGEFSNDFAMWKRHCLKIPREQRAKSFLDALNNCDKQLYPSIHRLLIICATLPVSVASSERSFSSLRRLKTYLRNKTSEDRLNGLALLNIYRDVEVAIESIIDIMSKVPRRMDILL